MDFIKHHNTILNNTGSVLISLIITMVVLAALGAAMVSLTSTSMFGQVGANSSARAYYLAESGYRYVESRYLNASDRDVELETLHNASAFTLISNTGQFDVKVYPHYFKVIERPAIGTKTLKTKIPGGFPPGSDLSKSAWLKIGPKSTSIYTFDTVAVSGQNVTFTMKDAINSYFPVGLDVLYVAESKHEIQTVSKDGSLNLHNETGWWLPQRNGTVMINNHLYRYKEHDLAGKQILGIQDAADPDLDFSVSVTDATMIILQKFAKVHSTGIVGQGSGEGTASREVVYHVPLPTTSEQEKKTYIETEWGNLDGVPTNWTAVERMHVVKTVGGDKALKITTPPAINQVDTSLITFNWSSTDINLTAAHQAAGYFLSYDAQVKIGFDPQPPWEFPPGTFFPELYGAGITFRLDSSDNGYGVSFLRGDSNFPSPADGIPNEVIPPYPTVPLPGDSLYRMPMIVLWQNSGTSYTWLAYKELGAGFTIPTANEATLMVRVVEGAGLSFVSGRSLNGIAIGNGDTIIGNSSGAQAVVNSAPIVDSGDWVSGSASGTLTIQNISGNFSAFETMRVIGSPATARVSSSPLRPRDNYIKIYIGNASGNGTPNTIPTDDQIIGNSRGDFNWPTDNVDDTTLENDYFQLIQWDDVNPAYPQDYNTNNTNFRMGTGKELNAIIRTNTFTTCSPCVFSQPEIGLHAMGNSLNFIYFDDFAAQTSIGADSSAGFVNTIQE